MSTILTTLLSSLHHAAYSRDAATIGGGIFSVAELQEAAAALSKLLAPPPEAGPGPGCHAAIPPDPEEMNDQRAYWAGAAITAFDNATHMSEDDEDSATILGDLLCDLMHWCDRNDVDFNKKLASATVNYEMETSGEN